MIQRKLTVDFRRSVTGGKPKVMEVAVTPLTEPSSPTDNATLVGGVAVKEVLLNDTVNAVDFALVPTDAVGLTERVPYRIAWREKYMGRQFTYDFVMPDFDVNFDDLESLGNIITGVTYLQWTDRGRTGGVAPLNDAGQVVDAFGNVVPGSEAAESVRGELQAEVVARQQALAQQRVVLLSYTDTQITGVYSTTSANLDAAVQALQNADLIERTARLAADISFTNQINSLSDSTEHSVDSLTADISGIVDELAGKAPVVNGKIPSSYIPSIALGHAVSVADEAAMLALTDVEVQPGDMAVRPDGNFFLNSLPPSVLGNWQKLAEAAVVSSVNGFLGDVVLGPGDVGARSASTPVPLADVSGLVSSLGGKTDTATTAALTGRVSAIENDTTIVKTTGGLIAKSKMPADAAFITTDGFVAKKNGDILNLSGGGTLDIADVSGLPEALAGKLPIDDPSVTNARTPIAHAASHLAGGTDALFPIGITAVSGLQPIIDDNELSAVSEHGPRLASLETRVEDIELGGGGGGTGAGASGKTTWWNKSSATTDMSTVELRSPFWYDGSTYHYEPAGADPAQAVWGYLTPNGHLKFIARNESAPVDPVLATQSDLDTLTVEVGTKADQEDLATANTRIDTKANQTDLDSTNSVVATKAATSALNATNTAVSLRALQSDLDTTNTAVAARATTSALTTLSGVVDTKAAAVDLTTLTGRVSAVETGKASLSGGVVPLAQLPSYPTSKVSGLDASLAAKPDLVGGLLSLTVLPAYPTSKVTGLDTALAAKADLVGGVIPTAQIPSLAINTVVSKVNRAGMLALTSADVQPGDVCVITATADKGSYILSAPDPSVFTNWTLMPTPDAPVQTINGQTGNPVLGAADVGARSSATPVPLADVSGLTAALAAKADASTTTTALATKLDLAGVRAELVTSVPVKPTAQLVATSNVSTAGQQSIDGTLSPLGAPVLLTAQTSSVNNGLWIVGSGAWTRSPEMAAGDFFLKNTQVTITGGTNNHDTVWQQNATSGIVGTNANNWTKSLTAGAPPTYTGSLGVQKVGNDFRGQAVSGGGISLVSGGMQLDPNVATRKFAGDVPASNPATITHNLNTQDVQATFRDKAGGDAVLVGWKPTGVNTISVEFDTVPSVGQWRCVCQG